MHFLVEHAGLWFVAATLLPLVSVVLLLLAGFLRNALRASKDDEGLGSILFQLLGGEVTGRGPAYVATAAIGLAFVCSTVGFVFFLVDHAGHGAHAAAAKHGDEEKGDKDDHAKKDEKPDEEEHDHADRWKGSIAWASVTPTTTSASQDPARGSVLKIGYYIDSLSAIMFVMVTFVATLIHLFSIGYMGDELQKTVEDHEVHAEHGHFHRRGRFGRFFMFLSLFCFSMLNLILADNLFQVFVSWELVGVCSYLLIGFYYERTSAGNAANKAFITNRIGDAGFIIGVLIIWTYVGTLNFQDIFERLRCPEKLDGKALNLGWQIVRADMAVPISEAGKETAPVEGEFTVQKRGEGGAYAMIFPRVPDKFGAIFDEEEAKIKQVVPDGPARGLGLAVGDVIVAIRKPGAKSEWLKIADADALRKQLAKLKAGQEIDVKWKPGSTGPDKDAKKEAQKERTGALTLAYTFLKPAEPGETAQKLPEPGATLHAAQYPHAGGLSYMPYWMLVVAGLGIFLGCVGKSAQFPLQVWLPDAMEGPTPVSALIHAATMVAAGVYLVGRCFPLFTVEVALTIAYIGAITLFLAAAIAIVMTDIKKVLAYSTVSQLGYMMLALGVGGWTAGLFHLVTHAFFKALLFLGSGSVIYGCHHQQDMMKMGGLFGKMKITALTMLMGVLAIAGIPLFSGWYSKDAVLAHALGFSMVYNEHFILFLVPLATAGMTTFYMFRMWFLTFTGKPRDDHVYEHAAESPWTMTVPLIALAFFSVTVGWGWPIWDPEKSWLEHQLHHSQPSAVKGDFGAFIEEEKEFTGKAAEAPDHPAYVDLKYNPRLQAFKGHELAGNLALGVVLIGFVFAVLLYFRKTLNPADAVEQFPGVYRLLQNKWYFDELYSAVLVRPALIVAGWARWFDTTVIDGVLHLAAKVTVVVSWISGLNDRNIVDGLANLLASVCQGVGAWLRGFQTGYIRSYVLFLVLAALGLWVLLNVLLTPAAAVVK